MPDKTREQREQPTTASAVRLDENFNQRQRRSRRHLIKAIDRLRAVDTSNFDAAERRRHHDALAKQGFKLIGPPSYCQPITPIVHKRRDPRVPEL